MPERNIEDLRKKLTGKVKKQVHEKYVGKKSHAPRGTRGPKKNSESRRKRFSDNAKNKVHNKYARNESHTASAVDRPKKNIEDLRKRLIGKAKQKVQKKYAGKEVHAARAVGVLKELDGCFNLLAEHCIEWYSMHFPEIDRVLKDNQAVLKLIYFVGDRANFDEKAVEEQVGENALTVIAAAKNSMGSPIDEPALKELQLLALNALNLKEEREFLLKFLEKEMNEIAPNFYAVAGTVVSAKLLAEAGSLKRLALMPSSTIQILGAEKALFRHLRDHAAKPPKHGFIFMHPLVQKAPQGNRGKMARALAGKLAIAAKEDYFGKTDISKKLLASLEKRFAQLKK